MTRTIGRIERTGVISFGDVSLHIWEEGISDARAAGGWEGAKAWERQFKRDVFARIVQALRRLGWTVGPQHYIFTNNDNRFCQKGNLKGDLHMGGRSIKFEMFQSINCPTRPDNEGRYEWSKTELMPYVMRLEMERTRRRIRDYLCNVFTGYAFQPPKIASPNPDPLAYFNDSWDGEYEKKLGTHRFKRGADGWPAESELGSWDRRDKDGVTMSHGDVRWMRDRNGRLLRGRVYGGINGMWMFVYGPGQRDHTHESARSFFTYQPDMPRKQVDQHKRRKRLEQELAKAIKAMNFERAAVLRDVLFPLGTGPLFLIRVAKGKDEGLMFKPNYRGYTRDTVDAGRYTRAELAPYLTEINSGDLEAVEVAHAHA